LPICNELRRYSQIICHLTVAQTVLNTT